MSTAHPSLVPLLEVYSAVVARCELVDIHEAADDCCAPWGEPLYTWGPSPAPAAHLVLEDVVGLAEPIECRPGRLGLWRPPPYVLEELEQQAA